MLSCHLSPFIPTSIWCCYYLCCQLRGRTTLNSHSAFVTFIQTSKAHQRCNSLTLNRLCKRVFRSYLKPFEPLCIASGWPWKFCSWFSCAHCYAVKNLCLHSDAQSRDQVLRKAWKNLAHSMHTNACMCCKVLNLCSLQLVHLTVGWLACHFLLQ